jgi:hypothetical protein
VLDRRALRLRSENHPVAFETWVVRLFGHGRRLVQICSIGGWAIVGRFSHTYSHVVQRLDVMSKQAVEST